MLKSAIKRGVKNGFGVILMGLVAGICAMREIDSDDLWLHMMAGRHVLDGHGFPVKEFYQYTGEGQSQHFPGVGFGWLYEVGARVWGLGSATWINAGMWGLAIGFSCAAAIGRKGVEVGWRWAGWAIAFGVSAVGFAERMNMRAETSALLGWGVCAWAISKAQEKEDPRWIIWTIPVVSAGVGWLHTSVFLLWLAWPAAWGMMWARPNWRGKGMGWKWVLALSCSLALPMATPNGPQQALAQPQELLKARGWVGEERTKSEVGEERWSGAKKEVYEYLPLSDVRVSRERVMAWAALALGVVISLLARAVRLNSIGKQERAVWGWDAVLAAVLLGAAWSSARGVGLAAFLLMGQMAVGLSEGLSRLKISSVGVAWGLCVAGLLLGADAMTKDGKWGSQDSETDYDEVAGWIAREYPLGAKIFIDESGNPLPYLLGEKYKVGYTEHYMIANKEAERHNRAMQLGSIREVSQEGKRLGVDVVCVGYAKLLASGAATSGLGLRLAGSSDWRLSLMGAPCAVFQRLDSKMDETERVRQWERYIVELGSIVEISRKRTGSKKDEDLIKKLASMRREGVRE